MPSSHPKVSRDRASTAARRRNFMRKLPRANDTAQRLAMALETTQKYWLNLQQAYDMHNAPEVEEIKPLVFDKK